MTVESCTTFQGLVNDPSLQEEGKGYSQHSASSYFATYGCSCRFLIDETYTNLHYVPSIRSYIAELWSRFGQLD